MSMKHDRGCETTFRLQKKILFWALMGQSNGHHLYSSGKSYYHYTFVLALTDCKLVIAFVAIKVIQRKTIIVHS